MGLPFEIVRHEGAMPLIEVVDEREWVPFIFLADIHAGAGTHNEEVFVRVLR